MEATKYLGDLSGGALLLSETRTIAEFMLKSWDDPDWKLKALDQNILQKDSIQTVSRYLRTISGRIRPLGYEFIQQLLGAGPQAYIQLIMVSYLIKSPIVADFMCTELAEAKRIFKTSLDKDSWLSFYDNRMRVYPELGEISDSTLKKMGSNVMKSLVDSGYLSDRKKMILQTVYVLPDVRLIIENIGYDHLISALECTL